MKLRPIRNPSSPSLPAAESRGSRRLPKHGSKSTRHGAHKKNLMASEVTRAIHQSYPLNESTHRYSKPSMARVRHVGGDCTARDFSSMRVTPRDTPRTDVGAELDESLPSEVIEIELQSILKANSVSRARHCCTRQFWSEPSCRRPATKKCKAREGEHTARFRRDADGRGMDERPHPDSMTQRCCGMCGMCGMFPPLWLWSWCNYRNTILRICSSPKK